MAQIDPAFARGYTGETHGLLREKHTRAFTKSVHPGVRIYQPDVAG